MHSSFVTCHSSLELTLMLIAAGEVKLEAVLWEPKVRPLRAAALLCHPHPLYGGTMNNRVVYRAAKGAAEAGLAALRFNFRGVGASTGSYDKGAGERKDVAALVDWLSRQYPALPLALVGFSFGAWVGLQVGCHDPRIQALVGLGLPLDTYDLDFLIDNDKPSLFIIGTRDQFCRREKMEPFARRLPPCSMVSRVEGADHMFTREVDQVQGLVGDFFRAQFEGHHKQ
jgi:hypothetical protein